MSIDYTKLIDCAAIRTPDGLVWTGKRHHHCIQTIIQATGKYEHCSQQGFVTMNGDFVTREEAYKLVKETGQCKTSHTTELFSEDLY